MSKNSLPCNCNTTDLDEFLLARCGLAARFFNKHNFEKKNGRYLVAGLGDALGEHAGHGVHALGDLLEPLGAVVDGVHGGHVGEQGLRRADVGRGLLAADVLLARLQRHAERHLARHVLRHADDAARHVPNKCGDIHVIIIILITDVVILS